MLETRHRHPHPTHMQPCLAKPLRDRERESPRPASPAPTGTLPVLQCRFTPLVGSKGKAPLMVASPRLPAPPESSAAASAGPPGRGTGSGGSLERVTVNLTARSSRALEEVVNLTGDTKTDSLNRAIQIYAYIEQILHAGGSISVRETPDQEPERLKIF
jgi:hypothetical protein